VESTGRIRRGSNTEAQRVATDIRQYRHASATHPSTDYRRECGRSTQPTRRRVYPRSTPSDRACRPTAPRRMTHRVVRSSTFVARPARPRHAEVEELRLRRPMLQVPATWTGVLSGSAARLTADLTRRALHGPSQLRPAIGAWARQHVAAGSPTRDIEIPLGQPADRVAGQRSIA
jgi:hypothetical protein